MVCALFGAYLALPLWLPSLVQAQLAQGWRLESLEFDYPVGFTLQVDKLVLSGNPGTMGVRVTARDLATDIRQPSLDAAMVDVDIMFAEPSGEAGHFALDDLAVPVIFQAGKPPRFSIASLRINLQSDGNTGNSWLFTDLQFEREAVAESLLKTHLPLPGVAGLTGQIEIRRSHDSVLAHLQLLLADQSTAFEIELRQSGEGENTSSEILGQGDLQHLQPLLTEAFPGIALPLAKLQRMQGRVSFAGYFTGKNEQILDHARFTAQNVKMDMENASLGLELDLEAQLEQDRILINFVHPGTFRFRPDNNYMSEALFELLPVTLQEATSVKEANDILELTIDAHSKIKLQAHTPWSGGFSGAASLEFSSSLLDLSIELDRDAHFEMHELWTHQKLTGSGTIDIRLESRQALTFENTASPSISPGASLQASGWLELDGRTVRFTESTGFRVFTPGLMASFDSKNLAFGDLEFSGTAEFVLPVPDNEAAAESHFDGRGDLLIAGDIRVPVHFSAELDSNDWVIDLLPAHFSLRQAASALEIVNGSIPGPLDVGGGTIGIEGRISGGKAVRGNMNISGLALDLSLAESTVEGAGFDISGTLNGIPAGAGRFSIDHIGLAAGLSLFQTRGSIARMTPDSIELDDLTAEFFGGRLSADHMRISPEGLTDTQIEMTEIDLGQMLEYINVGGLKGTGKLEIDLPVGSHGTSLYVSDGVFHASGPGILSYSGSISASLDENIGLAALESFHYSALDGSIDYHPDGSYQLIVQLTGSNPNLYGGHPIALRLNIGGMLPEAFEILFLTGDFDQAILNRIRQETLD